MNQLLSGLPPLLALIGTYCLILAYEKQHRVERVLSKGQKTIGRVVEIRPNQSRDGEMVVVDFQTPNGSHRHFSTDYIPVSPYKVGQEVEIWYKFYKSNRAAALPDELPDKRAKAMFRWGIILCISGIPFLIRKLLLLF